MALAGNPARSAGGPESTPGDTAVTTPRDEPLLEPSATADAARPRPGGIEFYGGYQVYSESGIDLTLLREQLKWPIEVRYAGNANMLAFTEELRRASRAKFA